MSLSAWTAKQFARPRSLPPGVTLPSADYLRGSLKSWWARRRPTSAPSARLSSCSTKVFTWAAGCLSAGKNFMSGRTFVDTNVLIYAHDVDAKSKRATAKNILRELWSERTGVLSMQVLQEFYVNVTRKIRSPLPKDSARLVVSIFPISATETPPPELPPPFPIEPEPLIVLSPPPIA